MADTHIEAALTPKPASLIGTWRRFGTFGPVYEIIEVVPLTASGEQLTRVRVPESGEEADYDLQAILDDPEEA